MRRAVLLGNPDTKRTKYLKKAAEQEGISVCLLDWKDWSGHLPEGEIFLKVDPPLWSSWSLKELESLSEIYKRQLMEIRQAAKKRTVCFFNTPSVIAKLLDKRGCKERLIQAGLAVTDPLCAVGSVSLPDTLENSLQLSQKQQTYGRFRNMEQLLEEMKKRKICQIFLKPVCGSGAVGVSAFRIQPKTGRMFLYTCTSMVPDMGLVNTKKLQKYTDTGEIRRFLDQLLKLDCTVERWYAKAMHGKYSYDLRVVVQERRIDYVLARLSKGPITNLQLNNRPLLVEELALPSQTLERVEELCCQAADCFPGLKSAGIDVLLEKGNLRPRIIEMNAQGDLIYQDIYQENVIYRRQAEQMKAWLSAQDSHDTAVNSYRRMTEGGYHE